MATSRVANQEDKMQQMYIESLQKMVESLCRILNVFISQDQIVFDAYEMMKQVLGEIKYYEKFNNKAVPVSRFIVDTVALIQFKNEHQSFMQTSKEESLPPVRGGKDFNLKALTTIHEKASQQSMLHNYMRKQSKRKNASKNQQAINKGYSRTINQPVNYLNNSRQFEIIRQETRRSLDNSGITNKKPLYKELQKFKGNQQIFPAVKDYLEKRNQAKLKMYKNNNYTISKFI